MTDQAAPRLDVDDAGEDKPFTRKSWDDLAESTRRRYLRLGHTREAHERGDPVPRDDDPPKARQRTAPASSEPDGPADERPGPRKLSCAQPVAELFSAVGMMVMMVDRFDGQVIVHQAEPLAEVVDELADSYPALARFLARLGETSGLLALATPIAQTALPIAMRHGLIPTSPIVMQMLVPEPLRAELTTIVQARSEAAESPPGEASDPGEDAAPRSPAASSPPDDEPEPEPGPDVEPVAASPDGETVWLAPDYSESSDPDVFADLGALTAAEA